MISLLLSLWLLILECSCVKAHSLLFKQGKHYIWQYLLLHCNSHDGPYNEAAIHILTQHYY